MKKVLGIIILGLLLSGNAMSANLKPLTQYAEENKNSMNDPTVLSYLLTRCGAFYTFVSAITYEKNRGLIYTKNNSKALDLNEGIEINADNFEYDLNKNLINAKGNAVVRNILKNYTIFANVISYLLNEKKIYTKEKTF